MYNGCLADPCADSTGQTIETFDLSKELLCSPERYGILKCILCILAKFVLICEYVGTKL